MIRTIANKEFTECRRDGRFRLAASLMLVLMMASSLLGWRNYRDLLNQAAEAAEHDYQRFGQQDSKHPHDAAHYGIYAFKSPRPLTIVDGGIEPYVGSAIMNGAHIQGEMEFPPARDMSALQRFGDLSPALAAQTLLPLLVILLSFPAFAGEREQGTLRQLLSLGVRPNAVLWGKVAGIAKVLAAVLLPVAVLGIAGTGWLAPVESRGDEMLRAVLLVLLYGLYLGILLLLSLGVSACCRSARTALALLLVFWGVTVFAVPRALLDVGGRFYPTPANVEFWQSFMKDLNQAWQDDEDALRKKLLAEYRVERIEDLPFDYTGQSMQVGEQAAWRVCEAYARQRFDLYSRQNRLLEWGTLIAPSVGVSLLSMALTGNDLLQHQDFTRQVEQHRRAMNTLLNDYVAQLQQKGANGWDNTLIKADAALWQSIPPFSYRPPNASSALNAYPLAIALMLAWAMAAVGFARYAVSRLSGV
ncbi:ABC transporter permease subunit [Methylomonas albis]|uniref:DUF3526 domain-containing protein n=1 Tax=Methylomonas albis TaxID=1854563 RepID=A0ABR9D0R6_9GAMM|nr:ABC transporter permease subunit [Methylomonas albis]MBD9355823.1 DUF3526 domain-containing protein [Methylomonas albis]